MYQPVEIEEAARRYDALLACRAPIDLVHLGLGPDGHTASLFPGSPTLEENERLVLPAGDDAHPHPRLTFTFPRGSHDPASSSSRSRARRSVMRSSESAPARTFPRLTSEANACCGWATGLRLGAQ